MRLRAAVPAAVLFLLAIAPEATPPDFSRDANVSIVAKNGNVWETSIAISLVNPDVMVFAAIDVSSDARIATWHSESAVKKSDRVASLVILSKAKDLRAAVLPEILRRLRGCSG